MFFRKKETIYPVKIIEKPDNLLAVGVSAITDDKAMFKDANTLSDKFQKARQKIQHKRDPWAFIVAFGNKGEDGKFSYFVGGVVDKFGNTTGLDTITIPSGTYAKITVEKKKAFGWTTQIAKARQYFYCTWLKENGYELSGEFRDMDYYDVRSRVSPPAMDIYFPIKKI